MIFFRKKLKEEAEDIKDIKKVMEELHPVPELPPELTPLPELPPHPEEEKMPKRQAAPLFVKIERYGTLLSTLNNLKETIYMLKHAFEIQKQIEGLKDANREVIESAIAKIEKKILDMDNEFTRPPGYESEYHIASSEAENLNEVLTDLKKKIYDLKSELKGIA